MSFIGIVMFMCYWNIWWWRFLIVLILFSVLWMNSSSRWKMILYNCWIKIGGWWFLVVNCCFLKCLVCCVSCRICWRWWVISCRLICCVFRMLWWCMMICILLIGWYLIYKVNLIVLLVGVSSLLIYGLVMIVMCINLFVLWLIWIKIVFLFSGCVS